MILRPSVAARVPVALVDSAGAYKVGMLPADISNGTVGSITLVKGDSTLTSIALVNNTNWFEIHATEAPGLYHVLVPANALGITGTVQLVVLPAATAFLATIITAQVDPDLFL